MTETGEAPEPAPLHSIAGYRAGYESEHRLRGYRSGCGFVMATWGLRCPRCGAADLAEVDLTGRGRIAAFTVQNVPADEFLNEAPYAYVVVELEEGGRITGWMPSVRAPGELAVGDRVRWLPSYKPGVLFEPEPKTPPAPPGSRAP
ncbi:MAG: Zn-ribbon domain-containing OB-fold protein [Thermoplasmata archaeon]